MPEKGRTPYASYTRKRKIQSNPTSQVTENTTTTIPPWSPPLPTPTPYYSQGTIPTNHSTTHWPYPNNPTPHEHHLHTPHHTPDKNLPPPTTVTSNSTPTHTKTPLHISATPTYTAICTHPKHPHAATTNTPSHSENPTHQSVREETSSNQWKTGHSSKSTHYLQLYTMQQF